MTAAGAESAAIKSQQLDLTGAADAPPPSPPPGVRLLPESRRP